MLGRVMVTYEKDGEGVKYLMVFASLSLGLSVNITECLLYCVFRILACQASVNEVIKHVHNYKCAVSHNLKSLISLTSLLMMLIFRLYRSSDMSTL